MRMTFRYSLTEDDYINFEKLNTSRQFKALLFPMMFFIFCGIFMYAKERDYIFIIFIVTMVLLLVLSYFVLLPYSAKKRVKTYLNGDRSYLLPTEITIDDKKIESKNIPEENEAGIIGIYPYSIMRMIIENEDYIFFYISNEVKVLPKRAIPQEFKETVFELIKKNGNYTYMK